jgi:arylsulfatase
VLTPVRAPRRRAALAALLALGACSPDPAARGEPACDALRWSGRPQRIPVVLIVNDTMRRDRTGAYGGPAHTPAFDRFARENLRFDQAYTQAPWTRPSIATLFTSLHPSQHGMLGHPAGGDVEFTTLSDAHVTLAEAFQAAGYRTAAFVANPWMDPSLGFAQGFGVYEEEPVWRADGRLLSQRALAWLAGLPADEPFFLYLHYLDSHRPYPALTLEDLRASAARVGADRRELGERARREIQQLVRIDGEGSLAAALAERKLALLELAYDKGLAEFDRALAVFLDGLAARGAGARAAVIVTSDHGEALYERGYGNHGQGLHDDEAAIPLAARLPGVSAEGSRVDCLVGLIDWLPTLCRYLALECPGPHAGRSLLPGGEGRDGRRFLVTEGVAGRPRHRSVRNASHKLIWQPMGAPGDAAEGAWSLFDVAADPGERVDLSGSDSARLRHVSEALREALRAGVPEVEIAPGSAVRLDPELRERLEALGYARE